MVRRPPTGHAGAASQSYRSSGGGQRIAAQVQDEGEAPTEQPAPRAYRFGRFELRPGERLLLVDGDPANVGARAFDVLLALLELRERVVTKDELLDRVWPGLLVEEHNLATQISTLRRVVDRDTIATVSGVGYRFTASVQCVKLPTNVPSAPAAQAPAPLVADGDVLRFSSVEWRPRERTVLIDGRRAALGSRAIDLLDVLISERHRVVPKRELLERAWPGMVVEENNLQVQVSALRRLLGQDAIATIPGRGYRFTMPPPEAMQPEIEQALAPVAATPEPLARTNLPHALEALFGRADDLEQLEQLLQEHRLITVLGAGGIGKTRVAQALARTQLIRFTHGVWWVDLGALTSPYEVVPAIAAAARVQLGPGEAAGQLALAMEPRNTLVVLDNCEHLVQEVSRVAATVLETTANVRLLATSQEPLRIHGEQTYRLDGLIVPPATVSLDEARRCGALMLLERRAQAFGGRFTLTESTVPTAIELCRQLDGIPLAIEMAASRLPQLGAAALHAALRERLQWMRSALRTAPARQHTLRATMDWSYSLLTLSEQSVLRRLSVFSGTFDIEAAQRMVSSTELNNWTVVEAVSTLVERSLIHVSDEDPPRYRLPETMRLYAGWQLSAHGETESAKVAHMQLMAAIGDEAERAYWTTPDASWLARYEPAYDDLQAAFLYACDVRDATVGAAIIDALHRLDELHVLAMPLEARLPAALALLSSADDSAALRIELVLTSLLVARGPVSGLSKLEAARSATSLARKLGDIPRLYRALMSIAFHATVAGEGEMASQALAEAEALEEPSWPARLRWVGAVHKTYRHALHGDSTSALSSSRTELVCAELSGSAVQALAARGAQADLALMCGDVDHAIRLGMQAVDETRAFGRDAHLAVALVNLCAAFTVAGQLKAAAGVAAEAIALAWRYQRIADLLDHLSYLAAQQKRFEDSLRLIGCSDTQWARAGYVREGNEAAAVQRAMTLNELALGASEAARLRQFGARLNLAEAKRLAQGCIEVGLQSSD